MLTAKQGLIVEEVPGGGLLIVDEQAGQSHALEPQAAEVWAALAQGADSVGEIESRVALDRDVVGQAVAELAEAGLLRDESGSRRAFLKRAAAVAGAAAGLKLVQSVALPAPAAAQSFGPPSPDN